MQLRSGSQVGKGRAEPERSGQSEVRPAAQSSHSLSGGGTGSGGGVDSAGKHSGASRGVGDGSANQAGQTGVEGAAAAAVAATLRDLAIGVSSSGARRVLVPGESASGLEHALPEYPLAGTAQPAWFPPAQTAPPVPSWQEDVRVTGNPAFQHAQPEPGNMLYPCVNGETIGHMFARGLPPARMEDTGRMP